MYFVVGDNKGGLQLARERRKLVTKDIVKLAVEKCVAMYDEMVMGTRQIAGYDTVYGIPPKAIVIEYGKGNRKNVDFIITDVWNRWYYSDGNLREADEMPEQKKFPLSGMFFSEAHAEFMIDENGPRVYLGCHFGPRYGRGFCYEIEEQGDSVRLCKEKILWIS